jgi:hypothetical protein
VLRRKEASRKREGEGRDKRKEGERRRCAKRRKWKGKPRKPCDDLSYPHGVPNPSSMVEDLK